MKKTFALLNEIKLVGITVRTNNNAEFNPKTAKIGITMKKYFNEKLAEKIKFRKKPNSTFCVYTEYESDFTGDYTYFIGEEVTDFDISQSSFKNLTIVQQNYIKFTSAPGVMPNVVIDMWQNIWKMDHIALGGTRGYIADFEVYDKRSSDLQNAVVDVYIGIKS